MVFIFSLFNNGIGLKVFYDHFRFFPVEYSVLSSVIAKGPIVDKIEYIE